jgi:hypothetical protein
MKKCLLVITFLLIVLSGCNLPQKTPTAGPDTVATQVAEVLTQIPTLALPPTTPPVVIPTNTPETAMSSTPTATLIPTAEPSTTPTMTPTQAPSSTPPANDPASTLGKPTWKDDFKDSKNFGTIDDEHTRVEITSGNLVMVSKQAVAWHAWTMTYPKIKNFYLEATLNTGDCTGTDRYGLIFRAPDTSKGYFYGISCDGQYFFRNWDGESFQTFIDWTSSDAIQKGSNQTNRLGVMAKDNTFTFYINGHQVDSATDGTYPNTGIFGLFIASKNTTDLTVKVPLIQYWEIK